jgi:hypothetical protein
MSMSPFFRVYFSYLTIHNLFMHGMELVKFITLRFLITFVLNSRVLYFRAQRITLRFRRGGILRHVSEHGFKCSRITCTILVLKGCAAKSATCAAKFIHSFLHSFRSVLRQAHNHFKSEFSTECDLVLPLSISCIL